MTHVPVVSFLVLWPIFGAVAALLARSRGVAIAAGRGVAAVEMVVAALAVALRPDSTWSYVDRAPWIPWMGIEWHVGLDGLSAPFVVLAPTLALAALVGVRRDDDRHGAGFAASVLVLLGALVGVYTSLDLVLFFGFWELSIVPVLLLVGLWGDGAHRRAAAARAMVTLLLGGVPLLVGLLTLATAGGGFETDLTTLLASPVPAAVQAMAWPLLLLGFAVKAPIVPLHGWMPEVVAEGPAAVGVMVMGLKIGVWGLLRFVGTCPDAAVAWSAVLATAGAVGAVYGALLALRQTELRRLVAWLGTSHVGVALIALSTGTIEGLTATVALLVSFAVVTAGLLVVGGMLHDRVGSTDVSSLSALATRAPRLTTALVLLAVGGLGLPGTIGFVGEHLALLSAFQDHPMGFMAVAVTTPLGAAAWLGWGTRALGGPAERGRSPIEDLRPRETAVAYAFVLAMWAGGLAPELWTGTFEPATETLSSR